MNRFISSFSYVVLALIVSNLSLVAQSTTNSAASAAAKNQKVLLKTNLGDIVVELDGVHAPISTANFLSYVDSKAYDGTIFHRVIPGFCVQGGGYKQDLNAEIGEGHPKIKNEATNGLHNARGTIAMARTNDPNSATSQFFFNLVDNSSSLDPGGVSPEGYAVFGKIVQGLDVMDKIAQVPTTFVNGMSDVPSSPVTLISATRVP